RKMDALERAKQMLNKQPVYDAFTYNDEHFARECRYDKQMSNKASAFAKSNFDSADATLIEGDIVEFRATNTRISFWGIFLLEGSVPSIVHMPWTTKSQFEGKKAVIESMRTVQAAGIKRFQRNNQPILDQIDLGSARCSQNARSLADCRRFNFHTYDDESFARECRFGQPKSKKTMRHLVTPWLSVSELVPLLRDGDRIEFEPGRGSGGVFAKHWALYAG
ncbi:hypothetical protein PENTCL1PPCAC_25566, partial [Pristionchus entomophagus]